MRISEFWSQALAELRNGRSVCAYQVVDQGKGSPGTQAARMLLSESGQQYGTIGGGIMEKRALESAAEWLRVPGLPTPEFNVVEHRATAGASASGLICGGEQTNLRFILRPEAHLVAVEAIAGAAAEENHAMVCIDETGIRLTEVNEAWRGDSVQLSGKEGDGEATDKWQVRIYLRNQRRMVVFGGGHCGAALARQMARLEYAVSVVEPRPEVLDAADLPDSVRRINAPFETGAAAVAYPRDTLCVVMTYSMRSDVDALAGALSSEFKSIGIMGSRPKIAQIRSLLFEKGFSRLQVDTICAPIGLSCNSDTPEEIAVSVAAQVLLDRETDNYG